MTLYHKVRAVERVYQHLDNEIATFQKASGLKCLSGCGLCCKKPDIAATPLEFLPLAYYLFKENKAYEMLENLRENDSSICMAFKPFLTAEDKGFCGSYGQRGLICRLFGFSASVDKNNLPRLATCKYIKAEQPNEIDFVNSNIEALTVPIMRNYYFKLRAIDSELSISLIPINKAIEEALKTVLAYYAYRKPRRA